MFFFKKNIPVLKSLIPNDYVDIHSHILPGIDDGAKDIDDTFVLIDGLKQIGVQKIITTPHIIKNVWNNTFESISETFNNTQNTLLNNKENIKIKAAAEYLMDSYFFESIKKNEKMLTIKDTYILVEMSYLSAPIQLFDIIFEIQLQGYKPILAHPERYLFYGNKFDEYHKLKRAGCLFQLNLLSTVGYYGLGVTKLTQKLLDENLYDFVGSDVHHQKHIAAFNDKIALKNHSSLPAIIANNSLFTF